MRSRGSFVFAGALVGMVVVGCNAILGNDPGELQQQQTSETVPPPSDVTPTPDPTPTTLPEASTDSGVIEVDSGRCPSNEHECNGQCVSNNDPAWGCGSPSCSPCSLGHATAACAGNKCVVGSCDKGYADCDLTPETGCEGDLSLATSCGTCNTVCAPAAPLCAPGSEAGSFACSTGCTPIAPLLCGATCVDPNSSPNNCGGCNVKCPVVANGTATCTNAACGFTCKKNFHACGAACSSDTDPKACGAACTVCPDPANATANCGAGGTCGGVCKAGFGDCNLNMADGCEAVFASDNANCGACGVACTAGNSCQAGACKPVPEAGP